MASFTKSSVTDDEWEKTEQALASIQMEESVETKPVKKFNPTEEIDSAFINAMNNPRERMMLFQFEDYMVKFVKSNEKGFEAPSGLNSFRRLIVYRLAQRFNLVHVVNDLTNDNGEKLITIYRTAQTALPKVLLIDYFSNNQEQFQAQQTQPQTSDSNTPPALVNPEPVPSSSSIRQSGSATGDSGNSSPVPSGTASQETSVKKVLVMKRNTSNPGLANNKANNSNNSGASGKMSGEDKERAYQEARARIFGESTATTTSDVNIEEKKPSTSNSPPPVATTPPPAVDASSATNNEESSGMSSAGGRNINRTVDVGSWKEKKSMIRNVDAERSDPDFRRNSRAVPPLGQSPINANGMQGFFPANGMLPTAPQLITPTGHPGMPMGMHGMPPGPYMHYYYPPQYYPGAVPGMPQDMYPPNPNDPSFWPALSSPATGMGGNKGGSGKFSNNQSRTNRNNG